MIRKLIVISVVFSIAAVLISPLVDFAGAVCHQSHHHSPLAVPEYHQPEIVVAELRAPQAPQDRLATAAESARVSALRC